MKNEEIKRIVNEKIVDYCVGIISIDNLVDFVAKIDPKYICKLLKNSKNNNIGCILEVIKNYDFYKENGDKNIVVKIIVDYYNKNLINT
jgi:hypothetical protein